MIPGGRRRRGCRWGCSGSCCRPSCSCWPCWCSGWPCYFWRTRSRSWRSPAASWVRERAAAGLGRAAGRAGAEPRWPLPAEGPARRAGGAPPLCPCAGAAPRGAERNAAVCGTAPSWRRGAAPGRRLGPRLRELRLNVGLGNSGVRFVLPFLLESPVG